MYFKVFEEIDFILIFSEVIRQLSLVSVELQKLQDEEEQGEAFARDDYIRSVLQQGKKVKKPIVFVTFIGLEKAFL